MSVVKTLSVQLVVDRISKSFGMHSVLNNIAAELVNGDVLLVTGRNGAGKSTLLRLLAGLQQPSSGKIRYTFYDKEYDPYGARFALGMVGPDVQLYRELTAREHIGFVADVRGMKHNRSTQQELLARVGLAGRDDMLVGNFSSGMQQRLRYALALMCHPLVLLLDEPTTNLDAAGIQVVDQLVDEQRQRGITIIATNDSRDFRYGTMALTLSEAQL